MTATPARQTGNYPARFALVALCLALALLFVWALPHYARRLAEPCTPAAGCLTGQLAPATLAALSAFGVPPTAYAAWNIALDILAVLVAWAVAGVILLRRPAEASALVTAAFLIVLPPTSSFEALPALGPAFALSVHFIGWLAAVLVGLFFYTFPNGRFVPSFTRWLVLIWAALMWLDNFYQGWLEHFAGGLLAPLGGLFFVTFGLSQVYRYRAIARPAERQQTKWVVFGLVLALGEFELYNVWLHLIPAALAPGSLVPALRPLVDAALLLGLSLSLGVAILRYRLWDIDRLISRALAYTALTAALAALYLVGVLAFQWLLRAVTGQATQAASVVTTLIVAALFRPLRARFQAAIDRRFYRARYDAAQVVTSFGRRLQAEPAADLDRISLSLVAVVDEILRPTQVGLWLRPAPTRVETFRASSGEAEGKGGQ